MPFPWSSACVACYCCKTMSTGNDSFSSSLANIALPPQSPASTSAVPTGPATTSNDASPNTETNTSISQTPQASTQPYDYYSSPEYQQYYQQYYANTYSQSAFSTTQQQYAAYYQAAVAGSTNTSLYNNAIYNQVKANWNLSGAYQPLATNESDTTTNDQDDDDDDPTIAKNQNGKTSNTLNYHCNSKMGLNPLIYTNIQQSPYFKNNLFQLKTYHEVIDEIYYNVKHLEPWEKGSRKVCTNLQFKWFKHF